MSGAREDPGDLPVAELQDQLVARAVVETLLSDIALAAQLLEVRIKQGASQHSQEGPPDLAAAARALERGAAVQLRYLHQGSEWWDTLVPGGGDLVRVIRSRSPA